MNVIFHGLAYLDFVKFEGTLSDIVMRVHGVVNGNTLILHHHELKIKKRLSYI